jgi:hypothetical protein
MPYSTERKMAMAAESIGQTVYLTNEMADRIIAGQERVDANPPPRRGHAKSSGGGRKSSQRHSGKNTASMRSDFKLISLQEHIKYTGRPGSAYVQPKEHPVFISAVSYSITTDISVGLPKYIHVVEIASTPGSA